MRNATCDMRVKVEEVADWSFVLIDVISATRLFMVRTVKVIAGGEALAESDPIGSEFAEHRLEAIVG